MPVIVRDVSDELTLQHALVENLHRDDLNPLEEEFLWNTFLSKPS